MCTQCFLVIRTNLVICIFSNDTNVSIDSFNAFLPYSDTDPRFPTGLFLCVCEKLLERIIAGEGNDCNRGGAYCKWRCSMHDTSKHLKGQAEE